MRLVTSDLHRNGAVALRVVDLVADGAAMAHDTPFAYVVEGRGGVLVVPAEGAYPCRGYAVAEAAWRAGCVAALRVRDQRPRRWYCTCRPFAQAGRCAHLEAAGRLS